MIKIKSYGGFICSDFTKFTDLDYLANQTGCKNPYPFIYKGIKGEISNDAGVSWEKIKLPENLIIENSENIKFENRGFGLGVINFVDWFNTIKEFSIFGVKYYPCDNLGYILECPKQTHFYFNFIEKYGCKELENFKYGLTHYGDSWGNWCVFSFGSEMIKH